MTTTHFSQEGTWEHFLTVLEDEFKEHRQAVPKGVECLRFTDLNYSVRVKVVLRVTRDVGVPLNQVDFNHVVVGRLNVRDAFEFIQKRVKAAKCTAVPTEVVRYELVNRADFDPKQAVIVGIAVKSEVLPTQYDVTKTVVDLPSILKESKP